MQVVEMTYMEFRTAIKERGWSYEDAASQLGKSFGVIKGYTAAPASNSHRKVPEDVIAILESKEVIKEAKKAGLDTKPVKADEEDEKEFKDALLKKAEAIIKKNYLRDGVKFDTTEELRVAAEKGGHIDEITWKLRMDNEKDIAKALARGAKRLGRLEFQPKPFMSSVDAHNKPVKPTTLATFGKEHSK